MTVLENVVKNAREYMQHLPSCRRFDESVKIGQRNCTCSLDYAITRLNEVVAKIVEATK